MIRLQSLRSIRPASFILCGLAFGGSAVQGQAIPSPNLSLYAGTPASTYNGSTIPAVCSTSAGALDALGNGCPATSAHLIQPYGIAIDAYNNVYTADNNPTDTEIRVIYQGGSALAAAIVAANPTKAFTPTVGRIYGFGSAPAQNAVQTLTTPGAFCTGTSGAKALDTMGDGCPAQYGIFTARDVFVDGSGNIFFTSSPGGNNYANGYAGVRVIYVAGTQVANLIQAYNPAVTNVAVGSVYSLSAKGDFTGQVSASAVPYNIPDGIGSIVVDAAGNIYVADTGANVAVTGVAAPTAGNQVKKLSAASPSAGWATYLASATTASAYALNGDGGPVALASISGPTAMMIDPNGNLYVCETNESRVRIVYNGGATPPLYMATGVNNASVTPTTIVTNPKQGYVYTVVGGKAYSSASTATTLTNLQDLLNVDGVVNTNRPQAGQFNPYNPVLLGMDPQGNLIVGGKISYTSPVTNTIIYRVAAGTGTVNIIGGLAASNSTGTISTAPATGVHCGGGTTGPTMSDAYGDGCPSIEVNPLFPFGRFVFDSAGNFYGVENRGANSGVTANGVTGVNYPGGIVRKYTFPQNLGPTPVGSSVTTSIGFGFGASTISPAPVYSTTPTVTFSASGVATAELSDANAGSNDACSVYTFALSGTGAVPRSVEACIFNPTFTPAQVGGRYGSMTLSSGSTVIGSVNLGGIGQGAQLTIDPATVSTIGSGLSPAGVGIDLSGDAYISDALTNKIYKSTAGGTPTAFSTTALNAPSQIAVSGTGTLYVADTGNNRLAQITTSGVVSTLATSAAGVTFSGPSGAAVDTVGDVYVADTGNNRIVLYSAGGGISVVPLTGLNAPKGVAVDAVGNLYVADSGNSQIVQMTPTGTVSVVAVSPSLSTPVSVAVDAAGNLFVADTGNQNVVMIPVGSGNAIAIDDMAGVAGIALDATGDIFVAASGQTGLVALNRSQIKVPFAATNVGSSENRLLTLTSAGNLTLATGFPLSAGTDTVDFSVAPATTNGCSANTTLAPGVNCVLAAVFQPQSSGAFQDTVTFPASNSSTAVSAVLTGTGVMEIASTTTLTYMTSNGGLPLRGTPLTLMATIATTTNAGAPAGSVIFMIDNTAQPPVTVTGSLATLSITLPAGTHAVTATYSGDTHYASSIGTTSINVVQPAPTSLTLATSVPYVQNGTQFTFTATVSSTSSFGAFSGNVNISVDGGTPTAVPVVNSVAQLPLTLALGTHTIKASFAGNSYYLPSSSTLTVQSYPSGNSTIKLAIVSPVGTITYGQAVTVSTTTTTSNSTATPTGTIVFAIDGVTQSSTAYAAASTATVSLPGGVHTLTATYSGDSNYEPATASLTVTVLKATPNLNFQVLPNASPNSTPTASQNNLELLVTVGSSSTVPTGTVAITNGATAIVTLKLFAGAASGTTSTNVFANYVFTATYSGDSNFLPATMTVSPTPTFALTSTTSAVSAVQAGVGLLPVDLNSFFNDGLPVKFSCSGMPAYSVCRGPTAATTLTSNGVNPVQLQFFTNVSPSALSMNTSEPLRSRKSQWISAGAALCLCLSLPLWRRRNRGFGALLSVLILAGVTALGGCASDTKSTATYPTPAGVYAVALSATDGTTTQTLNISFTVIAATP
jgi:sugar lactone lactonase YvrE